ncbi:unnamed protein product, partial [Schistosoma margrebowiei]
IQEKKNEKTKINDSRIRTEKFKAQSECVEANKQVKTSIRGDKQKYVEQLAVMTDETATEGNMRQLCDTTKKLVGKYSKPKKLVKDKEGNTITEIQKQSNRWVEQFDELLNKTPPLNSPNIKAPHPDLHMHVTPSTINCDHQTNQQWESSRI